jgi:Plant mobile domain
MFPNNSADSVPGVYLTFFDDMLNVPKDGYEWGQAILSCLYFNLSRTCLEPTDCIVGPLLLLQMWSWTRFSMGRVRSLHLAMSSLNCDLHTVSNRRPDTYSSTRRDMEDPGTFGISSRIYKMKESIGRRTVPTTMTCFRCNTCIWIYKFLKSIKFM